MSNAVGSIERIAVGRRVVLVSGWLSGSAVPGALALRLNGAEADAAFQPTVVPTMARFGFIAEVAHDGADTIRRLSVVAPDGREIRADAATRVTGLGPRGFIDSVTAERVTGWLYDPDRQRDEIAAIELDRLGRFAIEPLIERQDVVAAGLAATPLVGFAIATLPPLWRRRHGPPGPVTVRLVSRGRQVHATEATLSRELSGHVALVDREIIRGWVRDAHDPSRPVTVDIAAAGIALLRVVAADAAHEPGAPVAARAIDVRLPLALTLPADTPLTLVDPASGVDISGASTTIPGAEPLPAPSCASIAFGLSLRTPPPPVVIGLVDPASPRHAERVRALLRHTPSTARIVLLTISPTAQPGGADAGLGPTDRPIAAYHGATVQAAWQAAEAAGALAGHGDVVVIAHCAEVGPGYLRGLALAAYAAPDVGASSPLALSHSESVDGVGQPHPSSLDHAPLARRITQAGGGCYPRLQGPSDTAIYMRRPCFEAVRAAVASDAASSPTGPAAVVRHIARAIARAGFVQVLDDRTIVALGPEAAEPAHNPDPPASASFAVGLAKARARTALAQAGGARPRVLSVVAATGGGTPLTNLDLMRGLEATFEPYILAAGPDHVALHRVGAGAAHHVRRIGLSEPVDPVSHDSRDYRRAAGGVLAGASIELLHIRHLAWHGRSLLETAKALSIPILMSFHDYYAICPAVKLLDERGRFCGGACTPGAGPCVPELWPAASMPALKHRFVHQWQRHMAEALQLADHLVTTSTGARETILARHPALAQKPFDVIPHGRDFGAFQQAAAALATGEPLRILALGNLSPAKGAHVVAALAADPGLELHVLGETAEFLGSTPAKLHGGYARDEVGTRIAAIRPHIGLVPSIWPETHCHVLTELWAAGVPVAAFDLGAVGERIREHGGGWLVAEPTPAAMLARLLALKDRPADIAHATSAVRDLQDTLLSRQTVAWMAARYAAIYQRLLVGA